MKQKKVLLLGSYGQTNLGDDVLMWNYLEFLHTQGYDQLWVNANRAELIPEQIRAKYPNLQILETYRTSLLGWARILRQFDCVVYGGGTIYKELYATTGRSKHSVSTRMAAFNTLARLNGAKVYNLHIGIGSIKTRVGRFIAQRGLRASAYTIFRDQRSYDFAKNRLQLPVRSMCASTDGLFLNPIWKKPWHEKPLALDRKKYKQVIGINMLSDIPDWIDRRHYIATMRKLTRQLIEAGHYVVLIPFQHDFNANNDHAFMEKEIVPYIKKHRQGWQLLPRVEIDEIGSMLEQCDVLIGMRFHALLLATTIGTPFVAVAYDTKCTRYLEQTDYPYSVQLEELTLAAIQEQLDDVLRDRKRIATKLHAITASQYKEARKCMQNIRL